MTGGVDLAAVRRGRLTPEEKARIEQLATERNWSPGRIALSLGRHPGTINFHMTTHGLRVSTRRGVDLVRRNGSVVKAFTPREDRVIQDLRAQGLSTPKIAAAVAARFRRRRTPSTIGVRLKMLAARAEAGA